MRLTKLFVMAVLVGSVAVIGCSEDENGGTGGTAGSGGTAGTGGTAGDGGGGGADPCTGGFCDSDETRKQACEASIDCCNTRCADGAGGAGGAGGEATAPTPEECDAFGAVICTIDTGAGGGGGGGGGGGNPGGCDWNADDVCNVDNCDVDDQAAIDACKDRFGDCLATDLGGNECEKCVGVALEKCGGF